MIKGLSSRSDSALIGLVRSCIGTGAITIKELHEWVYYMIKEYDNLPPYMYYLMEASNMSDFKKIVGFLIYSNLTDDEHSALIGLSYVRGISKKDGEFNISKKAALNALKRNPQIVERFKETFPFIKLDE